MNNENEDSAANSKKMIHTGRQKKRSKIVQQLRFFNLGGVYLLIVTRSSHGSIHAGLSTPTLSLLELATIKSMIEAQPKPQIIQIPKCSTREISSSTSNLKPCA